VSRNVGIVKAKAMVLQTLFDLHAAKLRQRKLHLALVNAKLTLSGPTLWQGRLRTIPAHNLWLSLAHLFESL
jgi:hypothetical protein